MALGHQLVPVDDADKSDEESNTDTRAAAGQIVLSGNTEEGSPKFRAKNAIPSYPGRLAGELLETDSYID